jgi:hypothetical protein
MDMLFLLFILFSWAPTMAGASQASAPRPHGFLKKRKEKKIETRKYTKNYKLEDEYEHSRSKNNGAADGAQNTKWRFFRKRPERF